SIHRSLRHLGETLLNAIGKLSMSEAVGLFLQLLDHEVVDLLLLSSHRSNPPTPETTVASHEHIQPKGYRRESAEFAYPRISPSYGGGPGQPSISSLIVGSSENLSNDTLLGSPSLRFAGALSFR